MNMDKKCRAPWSLNLLVQIYRNGSDEAHIRVSSMGSFNLFICQK